MSEFCVQLIYKMQCWSTRTSKAFFSLRPLDTTWEETKVSIAETSMRKLTLQSITLIWESQNSSRVGHKFSEQVSNFVKSNKEHTPNSVQHESRYFTLKRTYKTPLFSSMYAPQRQDYNLKIDKKG